MAASPRGRRCRWGRRWRHGSCWRAGSADSAARGDHRAVGDPRWRLLPPLCDVHPGCAAAGRRGPPAAVVAGASAPGGGCWRNLHGGWQSPRVTPRGFAPQRHGQPSLAAAGALRPGTRGGDVRLRGAPHPPRAVGGGANVAFRQRGPPPCQSVLAGGKMGPLSADNRWSIHQPILTHRWPKMLLLKTHDLDARPMHVQQTDPAKSPGGAHHTDRR